MEDAELVNGNKKLLIGEYAVLHKIHGRKWRSLLKQHNPWHSTDKGLRAWQNIGKGTTGNEALRLIISDMKEIISQAVTSQVVKRQGLSRPKTSASNS